jgi:hypothetical protein
VKRSKTVSLVLLGGLSAGAFTACAPSAGRTQRVTTETYLTNEDFIPGVGYYHAPFHAFFPQPYNFYDPTRKMYFFGGQWAPAPHRSIVNISAPTPDAARIAESLRRDVSGSSSFFPRSGFGSTSQSHFTSS